MSADEYEFSLFANTGVQILCVPMNRDDVRRLPSEYAGWQLCRCRRDSETEAHTRSFIQWRVARDAFFMAIDTTLGDVDRGYFGRFGAYDLVDMWFGELRDEEGNVVQTNFIVDRYGNPIVDRNKRPIELPPGIVRLYFRPPKSFKDAHLVVDFGNSRTGALLMELSGNVNREPEMLPFELVNRYRLDAWQAGKFEGRESARWFSSRTCWCTEPYLEAPEMCIEDYEEAQSRGILGAAPKYQKKEVPYQPRVFEDVSQVRMGKEVEDLIDLLKGMGNLRTGVSYPKRYLWADDRSWLEGASWCMAYPFDPSERPSYEKPLAGRLLDFIDYSDKDNLLEGGHTVLGQREPHYPHVPRVLMTAALYELLCQAYSLANSEWYREMMGSSGEPRRLASLTLTYPSGMIYEERRRFERQALKAAKIFARTLGRTSGMTTEVEEGPGTEPKVRLSLDEASAVHLTYIWSEVRKLGLNTGLWFDLLARDRPSSPKSREQDEPGESTQEPREYEDDFGFFSEHGPRGGGTTDLQIARYWFEGGVADRVFVTSVSTG